jgi:RNA polymerase sigma-70 factor (ECF subfamily)
MGSFTFEEFLTHHRQRLEGLFESSKAARWSVPFEDFTRAVWEGIQSRPSVAPGQVPQILKDLRAEDLALAMGCARGDEKAWEAFRWGFGTTIYEAACAYESDLALARELSDSMMTELYGVREKSAERKSPLRSFQGRSSLKTWLRAVVYQKFVDEMRRRGRLASLPEEVEAPASQGSVSAQDDQRYAQLLGEAVETVLRGLSGAEKLMLSYYYVQGLTLKQIGRLTGEHEATVSRHLEALRQRLRKLIEAYLRKIKQLSAYDLDRCLDFAARGVTVDLEKALNQQ